MGQYHLGSTDDYNPRGSTPKFRVGDIASVNDFQSLSRSIDRASVVSGNGYQVRRYSNSTVIQNNQSVVGGKLKNFQVYCYVDANGLCWATSTVGTVNRCVPKMQGTNLYLDQVDENQLAPRVQFGNDGWIVIAALYEADYPFPRNLEIKFTTTDPASGGLDTPTLGGYPLAKVTIIQPSSQNGNVKSISTVQYHGDGNLGVSRLKVGAEKVFWNWWII